MNGDALNGLAFLQKVVLIGNECIDEDFDGSEEILTAKRVLTQKCSFALGARSSEIGYRISELEAELAEVNARFAIVNEAKLRCEGFLSRQQKASQNKLNEN